MPASRWLRGPLLGALVGLPILGGAGRLAMHAVSLLVPGTQRVATVQGTITVLLAGAAAGIAGGIVYALLDRLLPARRALRAAVFALVLLLLTLRGLHPLKWIPVALFTPVVLLYGLVFERAWHARARNARIAHA